MKDYIKHYVDMAARHGIPVQKPLVLNYEDDEVAETIDTQYLFGDDILVAPIYQEGVNSREVYLPDDEWVHMWTDQKYNSGFYEINAEIGYPPVFYRKNSEFLNMLESLKQIK